MKTYRIEQIAFSTFIYTQWVAYLLGMKLKLIGFETFEVDEYGNGRICGETEKETIKMAVPTSEWELL